MFKPLALAAAVLSAFSLNALAATTELTVYTALEAEQLKMSSPEIGLHLFHHNARCTASGVLYFRDRCGRSWL